MPALWQQLKPIRLHSGSIGAMEFNPSDGTPKSGFDLLPDGEYDIEVIEAEERTSQKGNQMIALTLQARHPDGYDSRVWDYLVSTAAAVFKIKMFCEATGLESQFQSGRLTAEECVGRKSRARITIEEGREGFSDRNSVAEYVASDGSAGGIATMPSDTPAEATSQPAAVTDEQIPF
jgi:hypothetical protein